MDNLDPNKDNRDPILQARTDIKSYWNNKFIVFPFNNRGEAGDGGDGGGGGDGGDAGGGDGGAGGDGGGDGGGDTATITPPANWRDGLDADIKEHPSLATFKTTGDLAKAHVNAQKLIGAEKIPLPPKDATLDSQEYGQVFDRLGRPSDPKAYTIPEVEMPKGMNAPSSEDIDSFKAEAHKIGLLPQQVEALYKYDQDRIAAVYTQTLQSQQEESQKAETELRKNWGKAYDANISRVQAMITKFGDDDVNLLIGSSGLGRNPKFIGFMQKIAANFGEDGELLGEPTPSHIMSPEEAQKEIKKIKGDNDHPWHKKDHAEHDDAMKHMTSLFQMAYPEEKK